MHFVICISIGRNYYYRHLLIDESDRTVLLFPRRIRFGMTIGEFFELQGALHSDRKFMGSSEVEEIFIPTIAECDLTYLLTRGEDFFYLCTERWETVEDGAIEAIVERALLTEIEREKEKARDLCDKCLRRCDSDLDPSTRIEASPTRTSDRRSWHIHETEYMPTLILHDLHALEEIDRLSWLWDEYMKCPWVDEFLFEQERQMIIDDFKKTWMNHTNDNCIFISATEMENLQEFREELLAKIIKLYKERYPFKAKYLWGYNNFES